MYQAFVEKRLDVWCLIEGLVELKEEERLSKKEARGSNVACPVQRVSYANGLVVERTEYKQKCNREYVAANLMR